jgi:hypothetical protein
MLQKITSLPTTAAAGSPTPATLLPQPFFFFFSQLGTCFKQLSETLQANQEAAAEACACARSKLSEPGEGLTQTLKTWTDRKLKLETLRKP